jgi:hypothetical protein
MAFYPSTYTNIRGDKFKTIVGLSGRYILRLLIAHYQYAVNRNYSHSGKFQDCFEMCQMARGFTIETCEGDIVKLTLRRLKILRGQLHGLTSWFAGVNPNCTL